MQTPIASKPVVDEVKTASGATIPEEANFTPSVQDSRKFRKLGFDLLIVIPAMIFLLPLFLLLALAVKLDSPGPIIYRRRVLGKNGRVFDAFKFRTMHINGDEILARYPKLRAELNKNYKLKCDPRVTRVGKFLRKFSLDELPQLFNIIKQDMSLVGPRIITPEELPKYGPYGALLLTVMPGLTGLWQISGRSDTSYDERVTLDMEYIKEWSVWSDLKILFLTIPAVLKGDGAY
ncbi:MAG: sugar transferase [Chloroflexota bacterium]